MTPRLAVPAHLFLAGFLRDVTVIIAVRLEYRKDALAPRTYFAHVFAIENDGDLLAVFRTVRAKGHRRLLRMMCAAALRKAGVRGLTEAGREGPKTVSEDLYFLYLPERLLLT